MIKVAVVYNEPKHTKAEDHWLARSGSKSSSPAEEIEPSSNFIDASEFGVLEQMQSIAKVLRDAGHDVSIFSADDDVSRLTHFLSEQRPDVIFNCCESILGESHLEMNVAALYELFGIAYTGSPALTLGLALNKGLAKAIFRSHNIPTPRYQIFERGAFTEIDNSLRYPLITKPIGEDASIGIDSNSIVRSESALRERIEFLHTEFTQNALAEEFIDGRELNVGVIAKQDGELVTLPISEISFRDVPVGMPHIVGYEAKWVEESPLYKTTVPECPAALDASIESEVRRVALAAARAIGLRDYGRIDLRLSHRGEIFVLEANPNPDISDDAGFMRAARISGRNFAGTINEILMCAIERSKSAVR